MDLTGGQIRDVGFRRANMQHIQKGRDGYVMRDFVWSELEGEMAAGLVIRQGEEGVSGVVQYKKAQPRAYSLELRWHYSDVHPYLWHMYESTL